MALMYRQKKMLFSKIRHMARMAIDVVSITVHPLYRFLGKNRIRILLYHRVCDVPESFVVPEHFNVPPVEFARQMAFLSQNGYNIITLEQFVQYRDNNRKPPPKSVVISFDDGYQDNYRNAFPVLEDYGFKGTFFVITDNIDSNKTFQSLTHGEKSLASSQNNKQYWLPLSKREIHEMDARGACFGSHTKSHCDLNKVDQDTATDELVGSREHLEDMLGKPVTSFSYPYGSVSKLTRGQVQTAGYKVAATSKGGSNTLRDNPFQLRRLVIEKSDSLGRFIRKVDGAYDWWYGWLLPMVMLVSGE